MKIAVECKSPLLQKSLEIFLSSYLSSIKQCDIVVRDFKVLSDDKTFYIGKEKDSDLIKPFSKSALILALEKRHGISLDKNEPSFDILEKRIEMLTKEYQQNILKAVRVFYEK